MPQHNSCIAPCVCTSPDAECAHVSSVAFVFASFGGNACMQVKALGGSLLLTGAAAAGCFYLMQGMGLVNPESPTSSRTLATAVDMMLRPQALQQQARQEQQQQQQQQELARQR